ncbi:hypothetical protein HMPREF9057_00201 [Actinomyces sp. oral taxon 171 str. F0337]|nr:hypothetical protein HMPREF9057_00201 [Actinomyces sp. oral taxon 171 str. F0337]
MAHSGPEWRQDRVDRELMSVVPGTFGPCGLVSGVSGRWRR